MRAIFLSLLLASAVSAVEKTKKEGKGLDMQNLANKQKIKSDKIELERTKEAENKKKNKEILTTKKDENRKAEKEEKKNNKDKKKNDDSYLDGLLRADKKEKDKKEKERSILVIGPKGDVKNPESFSLKNIHTFKNFDVFDESNTENMFNKIIYNECLDQNRLKINAIPPHFVDESSIKYIVRLLDEHMFSLMKNLGKLEARLKEGGTFTVLLKGETIEIEDKSMDLLKTIDTLEEKEHFVHPGAFTYKGHYVFISDQTNDNENSLIINNFIESFSNLPDVVPALNKFKKKHHNSSMSNKDAVKKLIAPIIHLVTYNHVFSILGMKYDGCDYIPYDKDGMSEFSATYRKVGLPVTSD